MTSIIMNTEILNKKALEEYTKAENEFKKSCCSTPSYEMALPSYAKAYTLYKSLKETTIVMEISDKIIFCNQKIRNHIGIATQYANITTYMTMFAPTYFSEICKYFELEYRSYLDIDNINRSASTLIKYLKYLDKMKYENESKYLEIINKTIKTTNLFVENEYIYKIDILKMLFSYIIRYTDKTQCCDYMKNMITIFRQLNQPHNIHNTMLSNILYLISIYEFENTTQILNEYYQQDNFILTEHCEIARKILFLCRDNIEIINVKEELDILLKRNILHVVIKEIYNKIKHIDMNKIKEINTNKMYKEFDIM